MNVRKRRITQWTVAIMVALLLIGAEFLWNNVISKEKEPFLVCAPEDMKDAFKYALKRADMNSEYELVMTDDSTNANVVVDYAKEDDSSYTKLAFSTFIVGYSPDNSYSKKLEENSLFEISQYSDSYEIDLSTLINAVIDEKDLDEYGIEGYGKIKVVYPDETTVYWHDFYNLMLIAANNGKYPVSSTDYNKAVSQLNRFFASESTEAVTNFEEKVIRCGGFSPDIFYIMPEKLFLSKYQQVDYIYPTETVYFNYYFKTDEVGSKILSSLKETDFNGNNFYDKLYGYRTEEKPAISVSANGYVEGFRNVYNIVPIAETVYWQIEAEE